MLSSRKKVQLFLIVLSVIMILSLNLSGLFPLTKNQQTSAKLKSKHMILIDVEANRLYLFENGICIKQYLIASGKYSTPTPIGYFKIVHKDTWGEGFGGRWMGFNVPWETLILEYGIA